MNKTEQVLIAGFGGQGVMMIGQVLAHTASDLNLHSLWYPSYGPETRGGTANCAVTISSEQILSPVFSKANTIIVLNKPSFEKFKIKISEEGKILYNSSLILEEIEGAYPIPMNELAQELGNSKVANMVMLGSYLELTKVFTFNQIESTLKEYLKDKQDLIEVNLNAIKKGMDYIKENF